MPCERNASGISERVFQPSGSDCTLGRVKIDRVYQHVDVWRPHFGGNQPWSMSYNSSASANALVKSTSGLPK